MPSATSSWVSSPKFPTVFGCGVLLIEHNMRVIMGACDRIHVIESGRSVAEGPPEEIQVNPDVMRAYLGTKSADARS